MSTASTPPPGPAKPTVEELGIDAGAQAWQRSGDGAGSVEIAFVRSSRPVRAEDAEWILMRVSGDPEGRVLVYDRHEWECFLDGANQGEFDGAATGDRSTPLPAKCRITLHNGLLG